MPGEKSRRVRGEKTDKTDKPRDADCGSHRECREEKHEKPGLLDRDTQHSCLVLLHRQRQYMAVEQENNGGAKQNDHNRERDLRGSDARKTSHDPVFDGSQLFFRVSHELQHHEKCLRQGVDRDPRENNGRVFLYWGKGGESKGQTNCEKSADKREDRGGRRCSGGKKDCEGGTCAGTGRDADDIGGRQRVPEDRLVDEPGHTEAKAADESHESAGQAEYGKSADRHWFPCAKIRQGDRVLSGSQC